MTNHFIIFSQFPKDCKNENHSHKLELAPTAPQKSPQSTCPHCGSSNIASGAGKKPGEESRRCNDCKHFLGYSPLAKLKKFRKRKDLSACLQILEDEGIRGDELTIFTLSLANDGGDANA